MDAGTPPVAPAQPAPDPNAATTTLASLDAKELHTWRETGDLPVRETPEPPDPPDGPDDDPPVAAAPSAPVSKRQQRINDQIREAVSKATAEKDAELARLRAASMPAPREIPTPATPPVHAVDPTDPEPDFTDATKYPGGEWDPKYLREAARWDARQERRQLEAQAQARAGQERAEQSFRGSVKATADAFAARTQADPDFAKQLNPQLLEALIPLSQVPAGITPGPINVLAEELMAHPDTAPELTAYLSTHPDELARLTARDHRGVPVLTIPQLIREIGRLEARLPRAADTPPPPNMITQAPAPPTTLGSRSTTAADPAESALKRGDVAAYIAAENARELAARK